MDLDVSPCLSDCQRCPRLVSYRQAACPPGGWGKPLSGWGDPQAQLVIVGLAPSIKGANRTGRFLTGDASAAFFFPALFRAGFCNQPHSTHATDGLQLWNAYLTCLVRCVPPLHRPLAEEMQRCQPYLLEEFSQLPQARVFLALGQVAWEQLLKIFLPQKPLKDRPPFQHGQIYPLPKAQWVLASYHPSPQNTLSGKLTAASLNHLLERVKTLICTFPKHPVGPSLKMNDEGHF